MVLMLYTRDICMLMGSMRRLESGDPSTARHGHVTLEFLDHAVYASQPLPSRASRAALHNRPCAETRHGHGPGVDLYVVVPTRAMVGQPLGLRLVPRIRPTAPLFGGLDRATSPLLSNLLCFFLIFKLCFESSNALFSLTS
jgi:hypothetical protein